MLRELLFMLGGQHGAIFVLNGESQFEICGGIVGLSTSEREALKPLLKIGSNVSYLNNFIECRMPESLYLSAVKQAIVKCITQYTQILCELEDKALDGTVTEGLSGLANIYSNILPFTFRLEYLKEFVDAIKLQTPNCTIVDTIKHFRDHCGISQIIETFTFIYNQCLQVLHKQIISWMLFGKLLDPYDEFFIQSDENKDYVIIGERIPNCLNVTLAQQALFVGESVVSLREVQDLSDEDWEFMGTLQKIPFHEIFTIISHSRDHMAKKLWKQVSLQDRLNRTLNIIRNTLLMKKGDVFAHFIRQAETVLDTNVISTQLVSTQFALNQKLMNSLRKYLVEDEAELDRMTLKLDPQVKGQGWDIVFLEYKTEWPLGVLIFTPETMQTYNILFRLLLKLRRIHLNLNALWKQVASWNEKFLELRWNVQHVLLHLSQYIQTDVIEVQKSIMDTHMNKCQDFDNFRQAHAQFLAVVAAQTFLHVPAMQACIKDLMDLALKMCCLAKEEDETNQLSEVAELNLEFEHLMQLLFTLLNGMYEKSSGTSMEPIAQLLLRLDFNHYFTQGLQNKMKSTCAV